MSDNGNTHGTYPYIDAGTLEARLGDPDFFEYAVVFYDEYDEKYSVRAITSTWEDADILARSEQARDTETHVVKVQDALCGFLFDETRMTTSTWTPLPTWRGRDGTYEADGTCPRCGCGEVDYDGPYFHDWGNETLFECSCPRCGLDWDLREYPNPIYEAMSDEEREQHYCLPISEIIL